MSSKQSNLDILLEHNFDIRRRVIYLTGDIEEESTNKFIKIIHFLDKTVGKIEIVLNSEGGCVSSGFAIYDTIKLCSNEITIKVVGSVMSIASIILQAGDKRFMSENSRLMIHVGSMEIEGHFKNIKRAVAENEAMDKRCVDIYLDKIKEVNDTFKKSQLQKMMEFDSYLSADKCKELGLIDSISGELD